MYVKAILHFSVLIFYPLTIVNSYIVSVKIYHCISKHSLNPKLTLILIQPLTLKLNLTLNLTLIQEKICGGESETLGGLSQFALTSALRKCREFSAKRSQRSSH